MDGPDVAGGLDGDADGGFDMGFDTDFGGVDGFDGAGGLDADFVSDSLMISFDHDEEWSDPLPDEGFGSVIEIDQPHKPGARRSLTQKQIRMLEKFRNDPNRKFWGAHVINHGFVDVETEFAKIAERLDCVRIDTCTPNFAGSNSVIRKLADWNRWNEPFMREKVPTGWYKGAKGHTRVIRQFWQLKKGFWDSEKDSRFDRFAGMVLDVIAVTWYYKEPGDFETRFQILIKTLPEYNAGFDSGWGIRRKPFPRYQLAAQRLNEQMARVLSAKLPQASSFRIRREIRERLRRQKESEKRVDCSKAFGSGADISASLGMQEEPVKVYIPAREPRE